MQIQGTIVKMADGSLVVVPTPKVDLFQLLKAAAQDPKVKEGDTVSVDISTDDGGAVISVSVVAAASDPVDPQIDPPVKA